MTKYRIKGNYGDYDQWLQYRKEIKIFGFSFGYWLNIPWPNRDWSRLVSSEHYHITTSTWGDLKGFAKKFPDIKTYFETSYKEQKQWVKDRDREDAEWRESRNKTEYL